MTTSSGMSLSSVISLENSKIPAFEMGYLQASARDGAYEAFVNAFLAESSTNQSITKAFIARRSGKSPEQITRYIASPGNWTIDTFAALCAAIGYRPTFAAEKIGEMRQGNDCHPLVLSCASSNAAKQPSAGDQQDLLLAKNVPPDIANKFDIKALNCLDPQILNDVAPGQKVDQPWTDVSARYFKNSIIPENRLEGSDPTATFQSRTKIPA